jgi:hypothetical protein
MKNKSASYVDLVNTGRIDMMASIERVQQHDEPTDCEEYREPLSIESTTEVRILLSWGGPEDGFKLKFSADKELLSGVYYRADWGEYKESGLSEDEAQMVFDFYMGGELI